ncbi:hypothetical protein ACTID9_04730 [Brevibacillus fluminis]|uniref:hypothetical protein n=1 Tax=Brevibacillus fluminis TaxID=511487 RepID=UPI003F8B97AB
MLLNLIWFTVKIERSQFSVEKSAARFREEQLIQARNEAEQLQAISISSFASRL